MEKDRHVFETMGKTRVIVENGKVVEVAKPLLKYCPLWAKIRGITELNEKEIKKEYRIQDTGFRNVYCGKRGRIRGFCWFWRF